jgi:hypothetical protein
MIEDYLPRERKGKRAVLLAAKTLLGIVTAISLIVCTAGAAVLTVYLISLLAP